MFSYLAIAILILQVNCRKDKGADTGIPRHDDHDGVWGSWSSWTRERECHDDHCDGNSTETAEDTPGPGPVSRETVPSTIQAVLESPPRQWTVTTPTQVF